MSSDRPLELAGETRIIVLGSEGRELARALDPRAVVVSTLSELEARLAAAVPDVILVADQLSEVDRVALQSIVQAVHAAPQVWVATPLGGFEPHATVFRVGELELDATNGHVTFGGQPLELRTKLRELLRLLCERGEHGASYEDVIATINRGYGDRSLVHGDMSQLRRALGPAAGMLWTKHDFGYALWPARPAGFHALRGNGDTPPSPHRTRRRQRRR